MGQRWTEEDEARRIQMIKDQEKQMYEKEMSGYQRSSYSLTDKTSQKTNYEDPYNNYESLKPKVSYTTSPIKYNFKSSNNNWCYRCASPYTKITPNMRHAVKNFLRIRRTSYPFDAIHDKCTKPDDLGVFKKQQCISSYCQTIVLTDHDTGNVFTIRGCAENFGAIDAKVLEERDDNTCTKLHDSLEMYECICKNRKYCYAGSERNIPDSSYSKVIVAQKSTQLLEENNTIKYTNNQWNLLIFTGFFIYMIL